MLRRRAAGKIGHMTAVDTGHMTAVDTGHMCMSHSQGNRKKECCYLCSKILKLK